MDGLNMGLIKHLTLEPPNPEQEANAAPVFSETKKSTAEIRAAYQTKLQDLDNLRQSLLQKAFAGELA